MKLTLIGVLACAAAAFGQPGGPAAPPTAPTTPTSPPAAKPEPTEPAVAAPAVTAELANRHIAGLMPSWVESLMIVRVSELANVDPVLPVKVFVKAPTLMMDNLLKDGDGWLRMQIHGCGVATAGWGGSKFKSPKGLGAGEYDFVYVYETIRPLAGVIEGLAGGIVPLGAEAVGKVGEVEVYRCKRRLEPQELPRPKSIEEYEQREFFVAVLAQRVVVWAARRDTIDAVIQRYATKGANKASQWPLMEEMDCSGPIVLSRRYDPSNKEDRYSPVNPLLPEEDRAEIQSILFVAQDAAKGEFDVRALSTTPRKAWAAISRNGMSLPEYRWKVADTEDGFAGKVLYADYQGAVGADALVLVVVFGINILI